MRQWNSLIDCIESFLEFGDEMQGAGLPSFINDRSAYVSEDCITA